ncbi:hypothetical protein NXX10_05945 [Bacteroides xylanisolvens]|nr:hypothetical protein [Bacteroides xylanisolvens]
MRKKQILFAFGMAALLLYACVRDELFTDRQQELSNELAVGKNRELTVAAAKEWYVDNGAPVTRMGGDAKQCIGNIGNSFVESC